MILMFNVSPPLPSLLRVIKREIVTRHVKQNTLFLFLIITQSWLTHIHKIININKKQKTKKNYLCINVCVYCVCCPMPDDVNNVKVKAVKAVPSGNSRPLELIFDYRNILSPN